MVQVHVLARVWGFESLRWHHLSQAVPDLKDLALLNLRAKPVRQLLLDLCNKGVVLIPRLGLLGLFLAVSLFADGQGVEINPANQTPPSPQSHSTSIGPYHSISAKQRLSWFLDSNRDPGPRR